MKRNITKLISMLLASIILSQIIYGCVFQIKPSHEAKLATRLLSNKILSFRQESGERFIHAPDDLSLFSIVFDNVYNQYIYAPNENELISAAMNGIELKYKNSQNISDKDLEITATRAMLKSLDPYSTYMNRNQFRALNEETRGAFAGLGIEVSKASGLLTVISPIDGTPAALSGIKSGDIITHADDILLEPLSIGDAVRLLRGDIGSKIKLNILRGDEEKIQITLKRQIIEVNPVKYSLKDNIGYIRITNFSEGSGKKTHEAIIDLQKQMKNKIKKQMGKQFNYKINGKIRAYILDLRNNPGGLLKEAIAVASVFLNGGNVVTTKSRNEEDKFQAFFGDPSKNIPLIILINAGSASASEIVAGALKDRERGILLGQKSYGKGSVQSIIPLPKQRGLKITTAIYYTPSGKTVEGGITPNMFVKLDNSRDGDEQIEEAIRIAIEITGGPEILWGIGSN